MNILIFVVYDGILNSVFEGQVLKPLAKKVTSENFDCAYLISFEKENISSIKLDDFKSKYEKIKFVILKRNSFIISSFLFPEIFLLKKCLKSIERYEIIARGALAGFITQRALDVKKCSKLTIQARGLLAEEYAYEHKDVIGLKKYFYQWRTKCYLNIEKSVFGKIQIFKPYVIEVVSDALKKYLVDVCGSDSDACVLAQSDIPEKFDPVTVLSWRTEGRNKLKIPSNAIVYCFSGAVKTWQCPELVIDYFKKCYEDDKRSFLLVLTFDVNQFQDQLKKIFPMSAFYVICVSHDDIYKFLSIADKGFVFRQPNIVSWVSRPVKAMEYEAVGLPIIHNNTVDWLMKRL